VARVDVVGAVVVADGRILAARRGPAMSLPGRWEFPGGKIEPGESPQQALRRELVEELGCTVEVGDLVTVSTYDHVTLTTYYCQLVEGMPQATEHDELRWVAPAALAALDWAPADLDTVRRVAANA